MSKSFVATKLDWLKATRFDRRVTASAHRVAGVIVDHLNEDTKCAFLAADTIGFESGGLSPRAVGRATKLLRKLGYLGARQTGTANVYWLDHRHVKSTLQTIGRARGEKRERYLERMTKSSQIGHQRPIPQIGQK